jgi:hypothetical protein
MRDPGRQAGQYSIIGPAVINPAAETSTDASAYVDMSGFEFGEMVILAVLTDTKTAIAQLTCASDAAGTGKADVTGKTVTLTGASGDLEQIGKILFNVHDLIGIAAAKYFVGVDVTTNQNSDLICATLRASGADYQSDQLP